MNAGTDKWWVGVLALVIAVVGGFSVHFMSNSNSAPAAEPSTATTTTTKTTTAAPQPEAPATPTVAAAPPITSDYQSARYDPIHFKPAIDKATDADCLKCHQEVLDTNTRDASPAGLKKVSTLAWYQTLDTYDGEQMTFHQRHLTAPFIKKVANMSCTTCHQGNNPRDEVSGTAADSPTDLTMRKMVDPNTCLMCHGQFPYQNMGLPGPWHESGVGFQNNCLLCHAAIRTTRHKVNFLNAAGIEQEGVANSDSCYGCHGGRAWYRTSFPYPRHAWPGAGATVPEWAKDRPTESDLRFLIEGSKP
ncbi:hypothetical protein [Thiothrix fructosivorans]|uniref:Doubled CXXCH motif domain-containing protein n=1 Tax=Thiothrix fructosivorans TaxID=111770 RepID=A0A8B0SGP0_9GAMM|nr:hypothetical protein [Thiothrix fructosivorans]MBO0611840.1 hypothetical protein [Thiothrix fructosivorans]QTX10506.1 hypothetical protein J1836_018355 [Thiothrix fructosivorans]